MSMVGSNKEDFQKKKGIFAIANTLHMYNKMVSEVRSSKLKKKV